MKHRLILDLTNKLICQTMVKDLRKEPHVIPELHEPCPKEICIAGKLCSYTVFRHCLGVQLLNRIFTFLA